MTQDDILARIVKPLVWEDLGDGVWSLDCPCTGVWFESSPEQRDRFESNRRARIGAALDLDAVVTLVDAGRKLQPYLDYTIGDESPGYHPTMPSAVNAFDAALSAFHPAPKEPQS